MWLDAWRAAARNRGLVPLRIASADASDAGLLGADAAGVDRSRLADLARRSDAEDAVVTLAAVTARRGGQQPPAQGFLHPAIRPPAPASRCRTRRFRWGQEDDAAAFNEAAAAVAQDIDAVWRRGNLVSTKAVSTTTVQEQAPTIDDWVAMRRQLNDLPQLDRPGRGCRPRYATVAISYPGRRMTTSPPPWQNAALPCATMAEGGWLWMRPRCRLRTRLPPTMPRRRRCTPQR
ncbi:MAG: hypothetical protein U1E33_07090 [Rhodospirillales bacterium]